MANFSEHYTLSAFLRQLADKIDSDKLSEQELRLVSEFYMSSLLLDSGKKFYKDEVMKHFTLGWYINELRKKVE